MKPSCKIIPVRQSKSDYKLELLVGEERSKVIKKVEEHSLIISDENLLCSAWEHFLREKEEQYLSIYSPINIISSRYVKGVIRRLRLDRFFISKKHYKKILNCIRCETHSDASKAIIEYYLEKE